MRINRETRALSFSDCYWIKAENDPIRFEEISPYYKPFWDGSEAFAGQAAPTLYVGAVRPLKKGLFFKIGKYFFKMIPPVGNQTYMLQLLYYIFYRNPSCILLTEDGNDKKRS